MCDTKLTSMSAAYKITSHRDGVLKALLLLGLPSLLFAIDMLSSGHWFGDGEPLAMTLRSRILLVAVGLGAAVYWLMFALSEEYLRTNYGDNTRWRKGLFVLCSLSAVAMSVFLATR